MTRYGIDAGVAIRLAQDDVTIPAEHDLVAPALLRSQALSALHEAAMRGELTEAEAQGLLARIRTMNIRLLGDRVLQSVAWKIADQLGWTETFDAEYIAVTKLQADALITLDEKLAASARELVDVAPIEVLYRGSRAGSRG
ncbi:type II toxin-antitoxin system VapC family toxin [Homoserinimonas sp. A447]